jgi:hypothetical protein
LGEEVGEGDVSAVVGVAGVAVAADVGGEVAIPGDGVGGRGGGVVVGAGVEEEVGGGCEIKVRSLTILDLL